MGSGGWEGSWRNYSICELVAFYAPFPGLTPQGTRQRSTGSEEGEQKRQSANTSYFIAAVACVRIEAQGKIFQRYLQEVEVGCLASLGSLGESQPLLPRGNKLPFKQTTMGP